MHTVEPMLNGWRHKQVTMIGNIYNVQQKSPTGLFFIWIIMNHYFNCVPRHTKEFESITLDVPKENVEEVLYLARTLADEKNITARRSFGEIVRGVYYQLMDKNYDRKNRKTSQRRGRDS